MRANEKESSSHRNGALTSTISLLLLAIAYRPLFALFGLMFVTACIILGLSLLAAFPKLVKEIWHAFVEYMAEREEKEEGES